MANGKAAGPGRAFDVILAVYIFTVFEFMIVQISTSVNLSSVARTTLLKTLSLNTSKALQKPESALTLCLHSDSGMLVGGRWGFIVITQMLNYFYSPSNLFVDFACRFGPCAVVTVFSSSSILRPIATELKAAIAASFRSGLPMEFERIKFSFVKTDAVNSEDGESSVAN